MPRNSPFGWKKRWVAPHRGTARGVERPHSLSGGVGGALGIGRGRKNALRLNRTRTMRQTSSLRLSSAEFQKKFCPLFLPSVGAG